MLKTHVTPVNTCQNWQTAAFSEPAVTTRCSEAGRPFDMLAVVAAASHHCVGLSSRCSAFGVLGHDSVYKILIFVML